MPIGRRRYQASETAHVLGTITRKFRSRPVVAISSQEVPSHCDNSGRRPGSRDEAKAVIMHN